jgi:A/G-specific adenine glycosylase
VRRQADPLSINPVPADQVRSLRRSLLAWYQREKRDLPWRSSRDPYRVWISEAMLQQTRVETVLDYYRRFLERFPTVEALAAVPVEDVLAAWSGLGYYRRARSLHAAARAIVEEHGGRFPGDRRALLELPGVGEYTAGAIASIAFDAPEPLVDGNVARVFARLFALDGDPGAKSHQDGLWSIARRLVPDQHPGDWNQALMELGALVCLPRDPVCSKCPLTRDCRALATGCTGRLPARPQRPETIPVEAVVLAVRRGKRWLLEQRPATGRMAGLWQFPTASLPAKGSPGASVASRPPLFPAELSPPLKLSRRDEALCEIRHTITNHRIRAVVRAGSLSGRRPRPPLAWVRQQDLSSLPLTGMTKKCLAAILAAPPGRPIAGTPRSQSSTRHRHNP